MDLSNFEKKWHLIVSMTKTKVWYLTKIVTETFIYNGNEVEIVNQYKYLGTIFSSDIVSRFKKNSEHLSNQAQKALFVLNAHVNNSITFLNPTLLLMFILIQLVSLNIVYWFSCYSYNINQKVHQEET